MKRGLQDRVDRLSQTIALRPIRQAMIDEAFEHFRHTGVLPDDQRLANEVAQLTLRGRPEQPRGPKAMREWFADLQKVLDAMETPTGDEPSPPTVPLRQVLLNEAVHGSDAVRQAARFALRLQVQAGVDVTADTFLADRSPPEHGSLGLHLLGFPECVAVPPYEAQARRLFARQAALRQRIDQDDPHAFEPIAAAIQHFYATAELPDDDLLRACVLADAEFVALMRYMIGDSDAELLATFDTLATADDAARADAVHHLQDLVRLGRLFSDNDDPDTRQGFL